VVHVAGAVAAPGLYRLGGDPRVADAIDAAGGVAADADLDAVNLAAKVADGERVYVPRRGEVPPAVAVGAGGGGGGSPGVGGAGGAPAGPVDLNSATAEQLESLPGVGPATAEAILGYRKEHGRFRSVDELLEVRGIGEAKLAAIRPKVQVR
jgi:competence protein ComEA